MKIGYHPILNTHHFDRKEYMFELADRVTWMLISIFYIKNTQKINGFCLAMSIQIMV